MNIEARAGERLLDRAGVDGEAVERVSLVGNPAMQQMYLGIICKRYNAKKRGIRGMPCFFACPFP